MAGTDSVSWLLPGLLSGGRLRMAQPRAWVCSTPGRAGRANRNSHHTGWHPAVANVVNGVSDCHLPGEDLGGSLPGTQTSKASWFYEARLDPESTRWPIDPHHRWIHPLYWRTDPLRYGLPRFGSLCLAALPDFTTGNNGVKASLTLQGGGQDSGDSEHCCDRLWRLILLAVILFLLA